MLPLLEGAGLDDGGGAVAGTTTGNAGGELESGEVSDGTGLVCAVADSAVRATQRIDEPKRDRRRNDEPRVMTRRQLERPARVRRVGGRLPSSTAQCESVTVSTTGSGPADVRAYAVSTAVLPLSARVW